MKRLNLLVCIQILFVGNAYAQGYQLEFEAPEGYGLGYPSSYYDTDFTWENTRLDMEGDGVLELITYNRNSSFIRVYDGSTHLLKWEYQLGSSIFLGFYDIDADGLREAVVHNDSGKVRIINPQTNAIEFSLENHIYVNILDIDNDSYPEIIAEEYTSGKAQIWGSGSTTNVQSHTLTPPQSVKLYQNYPNPFNPSTTIEYYVHKPALVRIDIYNSLGQTVKTLVNEKRSIGEYSLLWDGTDNHGKRVPSGTYFYQLRVGDFASSKKMLMIK